MSNTTATKIKEQFLVKLELRYSDAPDSIDSTHRTKKITIGVYDDFDTACINGNALLETLESKFPLHRFPDGRYAKKERFSKTGGCFGYPNTLVTNMAYLKTPFAFYAKIVTLKYHSVEESIEEAINAIKRYRDYKAENED